MTEEKTLESKQEVEQPTNPVAPQEEQKAEEPKLGEDESKQPQVIPGAIDYAAQLEAEQARRKKAEDKIVKLKKEKKVEEVEDVDEEEIEDRVNSLVEEKVSAMESKLRENILSSEVEDILSQFGKSKEERELTKYLYDNAIQKSGYTRQHIREDLMNANILANRETILKQNKEMAEALRSRTTLNQTANTSSASRETDGPDVKLNEREQKILEKFGAVDRFKKQNN